MRLFVAAYPSAAALDDLADRVAGLHIGRAASEGANTRLAARELWHVTVAFLGEVADERRDAAIAAVETAATTARKPAASMLRLAGGGMFGRGQFTTMWVGLAGDVDELQSLAGTVTGQLKRARLPYDRKPFRPHLTLARPGTRLRRDQIEADVAELNRYVGLIWPLDAIVLVESHQGPKPTHETVHRADLIVR